MRTALLAAAGGAVIIASVTLAAIGFGPANPFRDLLAYALMAAGGLGGAALLWRRNDGDTLVLIILVAACARAPLLHQEPSFSHDAYRYLWDGRMLRQGINPYVVPPADPSLHRYRIDWLYQYIDFPNVATLYPPLDLALFALADKIDDNGTLAIKSLVEIGDFAALGLLVLLLRRRGLPAGRAALYAWNPLVIFEFAQSGHEEAWLVAALVAAILLCEYGGKIAAGTMLGLAVLIKLYPLALLPVFFPRRWLWPVVGCAIIVLVGYLPFYLWNPNVFGFLREFTLHHRFNETLFALLGPFGSALLFAAAMVIAWIVRRRGVDIVGVLILLELAYLLLSPNVYPWYVTIFAALVPLLPGAFDARRAPISTGLIGWTATAPLAYASGNVVAVGSTEEIVMRAVEYAPVIVGLVWLAVRALGGRRALAAAAIILAGCSAHNERLADLRSVHYTELRSVTTSIAAGRTLYARDCAECHTPTAMSFIGPDLTHIARRRSYVELYNHIRTAVPGPDFSRAQARALAEYLTSLDERKP